MTKRNIKECVCVCARARAFECALVYMSARVFMLVNMHVSKDVHVYSNCMLARGKLGRGLCTNNFARCIN
jgi:hypothetical protein